MAVTKSEQDGEHPSSHYLVVEDPDKPTTWHLRVKDTSGKVDTRLLGAAHAALTKGYRGNKYEGPNKAEALSKLKGLYKEAGLDWPEAEHSVTRRGPIFKLGTYPDKQFSLDAGEAAQAVAAFSPVPIDSEHQDSVFDGRLGSLRQVELRGDTIHGEMAIPAWLHELFGAEPIPVSATWTRGPEKRIIGLALAKHPRVSEAAMMTALFAASRHDTYEGQSHIQAIHDMASRGGAVCNPPADFVSKHEAKGLQAVHDMTVEHGAVCSNVGPGVGAFSGRRHSTSDQDALDRAHGAIVEAGATCPGETHMTQERTNPMKVFDKDFWAALFGGAKEAGLVPAEFSATGAEQAATTTTTAAAAAATPAESDELAAVRAELARIKAERIATDAAAFADTQIRDRKALPAERATIVAAYTQAASDDAAHGVVTFGETTTSRVEQLKAVFAARQAHYLTDELVRNTDLALLSLDRQPPASSDARKSQLMGQTELGRAALKVRQN